MNADVFRHDIETCADRRYRHSVWSAKMCAALALISFIVSGLVYKTDGGLIEPLVIAVIGFQFCFEIKNWVDEAVAVNRWRDAMLYKIDRMEAAC